MPRVSSEATRSERSNDTGAELRNKLLVSVSSLRMRRWLVALSGATNLLLLGVAGFPAPRLVFLLATSALPLAVAILNRVQVRRRSARAVLWRSLVANDIFALAMVTATGGLRSPFTPVLVVEIVAIVVLSRQRNAMLGLSIGLATLTALLALAPDAVTGPLVPRPYFEIMKALNVGSAIYLGIRILSRVWDGFVSAQRSLSTARDGVVDIAVQRKRSLLQVGSKVAHELKNPLAAVKSLIQLEAEAVAAGVDADADRSRRRLEVVAREIVRMEAVLRDYLSFSRPLEDLRISPVNLAEVADSVALLLEGRAAAAGVRLQRTGTVERVGGDARHIEEALLNVASNAIEATPRGGTVTIRTERREGGAVIVVEDTGEGMSAAILEKVGTPFFTTRSEGTGIGVALARAALVQHGGRLEYASRPGVGTTATLELPDQAASGVAPEGG